VQSNVDILGKLEVNNSVTLNDIFTIKNGDDDVFRVDGTALYLHDDMYREISRKIVLSNIDRNDGQTDSVFNKSVLIKGELTTDSNLIANSEVFIGGSLSIHEDVTIDGNLKVKDTVIFNKDLLLQNKLQVLPMDTSNQSWWNIYCDSSVDEVYEADLLFESKNGSKMTFHDQFEESIINFTGQHRCSIIKTNIPRQMSISDFIGRIVISTGEYHDLHNNNKIRINEAIPKVKLCNVEMDQRVFGVISGEEEIGKYREFKFGNLSFFLNKKKNNKKVMINSVGEGGVWVCNINGNFTNGDYITSSGVYGYGMYQGDNIQRNYTVAKITCDCLFDLESPIYDCDEFIYKEKTIRRAFVGCIYYC
jgi:hypothetical protein